MTQSGEPVIRVKDLKKHYGDVKAVDGVTFEVARGEVFGMLGPNGAGKTTTIEVLEGLRPPDSGTVEVFGLDVCRHPESIKQRIGVQLQTRVAVPATHGHRAAGPVRQLLRASSAAPSS